MLVVISANGPVDTAVRELRIAGEIVHADDVKRSALLQEIAQLEGQTEIAISEAAFRQWQRFQPCESSLEELASILQVRSKQHASMHDHCYMFTTTCDPSSRPAARGRAQPVSTIATTVACYVASAYQGTVALVRPVCGYQMS